MNPSIDQLCINTIRMLSIDAVQKANSGHPGAPMGLAPAAYVLWTRFSSTIRANPQWPDRDRFVLSAGHGIDAALQHASSHRLRPAARSNQKVSPVGQPHSRPSRARPHAGVETTTGPLGQGFGNGVGMAIAEAHLAARYNRPGFDVVSHFTYAIVSDGDLMEGVASEAACLAGHLKLGKLVYLYDNNRISLAGGGRSQLYRRLRANGSKPTAGIRYPSPTATISKRSIAPCARPARSNRGLR